LQAAALFCQRADFGAEFLQAMEKRALTLKGSDISAKRDQFG
jgi:hypothetical protein